MSDARPMEAGSSLVLRAAQDRRSSFQPRLPVFEGPLEVLLRLVERQELAITEVSLAAVADQFLAHLDTLPDRDPALLAEFAAVASRLLLLKTRVLFPRQPHAPAEDDAEEDEDDLVTKAAGEIDPEKRAQMYRDAEKIMQEEGVYVPLWYPFAVQLYKPTVAGLPKNAKGSVQPDWNIFIDQHRVIYKKRG